MTNEQLRSTDAYKLIYESYVYAFQKGLESVNGDLTKLNVGSISQTVANIISRPEAAEILNVLSMEEVGKLIGMVLNDICPPMGES